MELSTAIRNASQILDEERSSPTVKYTLRTTEPTPSDTAGQVVAALSVITGAQLLRSIRWERPRPVEENPKKWTFESVNYNLPCALLSQLPEDSRPGYHSFIIARLSRPPGCAKAKYQTEPSWKGLVSDFPLIAEFCLRNGAKEAFIRSLYELTLFDGHAILLRHLEDLIALNFAVLAERDYEALAGAITAVGNRARIALKALRDSGGSRGEAGQFWVEVKGAADGIMEECRKARYYYLKGMLLEGLNLEINQDKAAVEDYLKTQGFGGGLIECLNRVDQIYQSAATGFDFKTLMGHLRSFLERLASEGLAKLNVAAPGPDKTKWGDCLKCLREEGMLSLAEEALASALYRVLSDEGVHPIVAEKEYARLARNMVIEYALLFLRRLQKMQPRLSGPLNH